MQATGYKHAPGGPYHPPKGIRTRCTYADTCPMLETKMNFKIMMIAAHVSWIKDHPKDKANHPEEVSNEMASLDKCREIYEAKKCYDNKNCPKSNVFDLVKKALKSIRNWLETHKPMKRKTPYPGIGPGPSGAPVFVP